MKEIAFVSKYAKLISNGFETIVYNWFNQNLMNLAVIVNTYSQAVYLPQAGLESEPIENKLNGENIA